VASIKLVEVTRDSIQLLGELSRHTVMSFSHQQLKTLLQSAKLQIDLSGLTKVDTAGLAWLLQMVETAAKRGCALQLTHLPPDLVKLAMLSGVTNFLPISQPTA
jgi:phospholipid transport system transporter-binding protein